MRAVRGIKSVASGNMTIQGGAREPAKDTIWCIHYECRKYLKVCDRCRVRIKCRNYQDYWAPRFDY